MRAQHPWAAGLTFQRCLTGWPGACALGAGYALRVWAHSGDMVVTIRLRSSRVANSTTILPLWRPSSTLTLVSNTSDSWFASALRPGAVGFLAAVRRGVGGRSPPPPTHSPPAPPPG